MAPISFFNSPTFCLFSRLYSMGDTLTSCWARSSLKSWRHVGVGWLTGVGKWNQIKISKSRSTGQTTLQLTRSVRLVMLNDFTNIKTHLCSWHWLWNLLILLGRDWRVNWWPGYQWSSLFISLRSPWELHVDRPLVRLWPCTLTKRAARADCMRSGLLLPLILTPLLMVTRCNWAFIIDKVQCFHNLLDLFNSAFSRFPEGKQWRVLHQPQLNLKNFWKWKDEKNWKYDMVMHGGGTARTRSTKKKKKKKNMFFGGGGLKNKF
jgi:hypothetical protein